MWNSSHYLLTRVIISVRLLSIYARKVDNLYYQATTNDHKRETKFKRFRIFVWVLVQLNVLLFFVFWRLMVFCSIKLSHVTDRDAVEPKSLQNIIKHILNWIYHMWCRPIVYDTCGYIYILYCIRWLKIYNTNKA